MKQKVDAGWKEEPELAMITLGDAHHENLAQGHAPPRAISIGAFLQHVPDPVSGEPGGFIRPRAGKPD